MAAKVKIDYLRRAWITTIIGLIMPFILDRALIAFVILTWYFIYKDAEQRNISKAHGAWSLLCILGMAIYHFFFTRKNKKK